MVYVEKHTKHPLIMSKNNNNQIITATAILAQTLIAVLAMTLVSLCNAQTISRDQAFESVDGYTGGTAWVLTQPKPVTTLQDAVERDINLTLVNDRRRLISGTTLLVCGLSMNNNGNDALAIKVASVVSVNLIAGEVGNFIKRRNNLRALRNINH